MFSVSDDGISGLEAGFNDVKLADGTECFQWGCLGSDVSDVANLDTYPATGMDPNSGEANTTAIIGQSYDTPPPRGTTAAKSARGYAWPVDELTGGYLPNR